MMTRVQINDWRERTIEVEEDLARGGEGYTKLDRDDASGWPACAVGEIYGKSGRQIRKMIADAETFNWDGPKDKVLRRLGGNFSSVVGGNDFLRAYEIIDLIEARVLHLRAKKAA